MMMNRSAIYKRDKARFQYRVFHSFWVVMNIMFAGFLLFSFFNSQWKMFFFVQSAHWQAQNIYLSNLLRYWYQYTEILLIAVFWIINVVYYSLFLKGKDVL